MTYTFDIYYHYGDSHHTDLMDTKDFAEQKYADSYCSRLSDHISAEDWERGDYYFAIKRNPRQAKKKKGLLMAEKNGFWPWAVSVKINERVRRYISEVRRKVSEIYGHSLTDGEAVGIILAKACLMRAMPNDRTIPDVLGEIPPTSADEAKEG